MPARRMYAAAHIGLVMLMVLAAGCGEDSSYDQRTIVYVSNINCGAPYICDVLNQGDSLYYTDTFTYKLSDDYIEADLVKVEVHNRPYNSIVDPNKSLGDVLITGYDVSFVPTDGGPVPVQPFSGETSVLVPANGMVEFYIVLVPLVAKTLDPLVSMQYTNDEIFTNARINFHAHEIQTNRELTFSAGLHVNFTDIIAWGQLR